MSTTRVIIMVIELVTDYVVVSMFLNHSESIAIMENLCYCCCSEDCTLKVISIAN